MKRKFLLFFLIAVLLLPMLPAFSRNAAAAGQGEGNTYEVALLIDVSGSMNQADPQRISIEAAKAFAYYHPSRAGYFKISVILYNTEVSTVLQSVDVCTDSGMERYQSCLDQVGKLENSGKYNGFTCWSKDTDIGAAIVKAKDILLSSDAGKKAVILFTDGKIDLDNDFSVTTPEEKRSEDDSFECAQLFASKGIPMYTVGLNRNNGVDKDYMQRLADMTGGLFQYCTSANDLVKFFQDMYAYFVGGTMTDGGSIQTQANVESSYRVNIYGQAISEVNLVLFSTSKIRTYTVTNPNGATIASCDPSGNETAAAGCQVDRNDYTVNVKLTAPSDGYWTVSFTSATSGTVQIGEIYLYNLQVNDEAKKDVTVGDTVTFSPVLFNADTGNRVLTQAIYENSECTVSLALDGSSETHSAKLSDAKNGYTLSVPMTAPGSYDVTYRIVNEQFTVETVGKLNVLPPKLEVKANKTSVRPGEAVELTVRLVHPLTGQPMEVPSYLSGFSLAATVKKDGKEIATLDSSEGKKEITLTYTPDQPGEYQVSAVASRYEDRVSGNSASFTVWRPELAVMLDGSEICLGDQIGLRVGMQNPTNQEKIPLWDTILNNAVRVEILLNGQSVEVHELNPVKGTDEGELSFTPDRVGNYSILVSVPGMTDAPAAQTVEFKVQPSRISQLEDLPDLSESLLFGKVEKEIDLSDYFSDSDGDDLAFEVSCDSDRISAEMDGERLILSAGAGQGTIEILVRDGRGAEYTASFAVSVKSRLPIFIGALIAVVIVGAVIPVVLSVLKKRRTIRMRYRIKLSANGRTAVYDIGRASNNRRAKPLMTVREILCLSTLSTFATGDMDEELRGRLIDEFCPKLSVTGYPFKEGIRILLPDGKEKVFLKYSVTVPFAAKEEDGLTDVSVSFGKTTDFQEETLY